MHGDCFNGECDSNCGGGMSMYMDHGMLAFLMMLLLGIDIYAIDEEEL